MRFIFLPPKINGMIPAERNGIVKSDILLSVDGNKLGTMQDLIREIWKVGVGKKIALEILRGKKRFEAEVKLEKMGC